MAKRGDTSAVFFIFVSYPWPMKADRVHRRPLIGVTMVRWCP